MTDMDVQSQAVPEIPPSSVAPAPVPEEKVLRQSEVNEIVGRVRSEGYEKGRKEALSQSPQVQPTSNPHLTEEQIRQMMREEAARAQEEQARMAVAHQIIGDFSQKMANGKEKYADFDDVVGALDLPKIPEIVQLVHNADNVPDIMYELGKNPGKIGTLLNLAKHAPHLAQAEMNRLSKSIKDNEQAKAQAQPKDPLSPLKPSNVATDSGEMSIKDFMNASWLKR